MLTEKIEIAKVNNEIISEFPKDLYIAPDALHVFLEMFEGPLDLLLYLIRKQDLDILAIPMKQVTDQYINYITTMQILNIDLAAEYLLMAAILLEIKSRMLLPKPPKSDLADLEEDPRNDLIKRLIEYEKIKQVAEKLDQIPRSERDYLWVNIGMNNLPELIPQVSINDLTKAWQEIFKKSLLANKIHIIPRHKLSIRQYMSNIMKKLSQVKYINFFDLFEPNFGISHVVVGFISILELAKENLIILTQTNQEIQVSLYN